MDYEKLSSYIINLLKKELDPRLYYHSIEHTLGVINDCELLFDQYDLTDEDKSIVKTAALLHDVGFLVVYHNHEEKGSIMAGKILPEYGYSKEQISKIQRLIEVTRVPEKPLNELEYIIVDADLFYLGTDTFNRISGNLFKEWSAFNLVDGIEDFLQKQINFLEWHEYYTPYAKELLNNKKEKNLLLVKEELKRLSNNNDISSKKIIPFHSWKDNKLLKNLSEEQFAFLEDYIEKRHYEKGDIIVKEGAGGDEIYLIEQGKVIIEKQGVELATKEAGDFFGTMILIEEAKRSASVVVAEKVHLVILKKTDIFSISKGVEESTFFKIIKNQLKGQQAALRSTNNLGVLQAKGQETEKQKRRQFGTFISYIVDSISNFVILIDNDRRIMDSNKAWERISGYSKNEFVGNHLFNYVDNLEEIIESSRSLNHKFKETNISHSRGTAVPVQMNATPVFEGEVLNGYIISGTDLTTEYKTREQLEKYVFDLEEKNILLRHFTYILSHDLKEPIRTIRSYSDMLSKRYAESLDTVGLEFIEFINEGTKKLTAMIDGLLEYSRLDKKDVNKSVTSLTLLVDDVKLVIKRLIEDYEGTVNVKDTCQVFADKLLIKQVFQNLIVNALKYSRSDVKPVVEVNAYHIGKDTIIRVSDNGKGISEDRLEEVFNLFQRGPEKHQVEGTGIGLGICHKIVSMHRGKIWVESTLGKGSDFFIKLPSKSSAS